MQEIIIIEQSWGGGGGVHLREVWVEVCYRGLQTLSLFKTKIVYFASLFQTRAGPFLMILIHFI